LIDFVVERARLRFTVDCISIDFWKQSR